MSLVGESERKILKEVVKSAKNSVKARVLPPGMLASILTRHSSGQEKTQGPWVVKGTWNASGLGSREATSVVVFPKMNCDCFSFRGDPEVQRPDL